MVVPDCESHNQPRLGCGTADGDRDGLRERALAREGEAAVLRDAYLLHFFGRWRQVVGELHAMRCRVLT